MPAMSDVTRTGNEAQYVSTPGTVMARVSLVLVTIIWGLNWPAAKFVLRDLSPWTFRAVGLGCGTAALMIVVKRCGYSLYVKRGRPRLHVLIAGLLNIGGFCILSAFAQLGTATSRAAICAYTMPIWATVLARLVLGERLDWWRRAALASGICGLLVLLWPLATTGLPVGILFALGSALSWAMGTVYLKWARIDAHPVAITTWQLAVGALAVSFGLLVIGVQPGRLHLIPAIALAYNALAGTALAYLLWFQLVARLPASTAGFGTLLVPVIGVLASALLLGDRPSVADVVGFALIFVAAVCALGPLQMARSHPASSLRRSDFGKAR
jgi:drug/metabolite transporter (DMT)-like permease